MTQIRARVTATHGTSARLVERAGIGRPLRILDIQLATRGECLSGAAVPRGQNAIKHVDTARYCVNQILRCTNAHQVSWSVFRHSRRDVFDYVKHQRLLFPNAQATDGVTVKADIYSLFETVASQIEVAGALDDAEECLGAAQVFGF